MKSSLRILAFNRSAKPRRSEKASARSKQIRDRAATNKSLPFSPLFSFMLLTILFINLFYAQSTQGTTQQSQQSNIITLRNIPWELTVLAAIFASLAILVLGYMISKPLGIKELAAWSTSELYQLLMLSFFVFLIFGILRIETMVFEAYGLCSFSQGGLCCSSQSCSENPAILNAREYLSSVRGYLTFVIGGLLFEKGVLSLSNFLLSESLGLLGDTSIAKELLGKKLSFTPFHFGAGIHKDISKSIITPISSILEQVVMPFTLVYGFNSMQLYFLDFIENLAFHFFLPFGIFFRMFSFSKRFGNILICLAIAFYIVFPLSYLISQDIVDAVLNFDKPSHQYSWKDILAARIGSSSEISTLANEGFLKAAIRDAGSSLSTLCESLFSFVFAIFDEAAFAFVLFTLVPIINFTITISIAKEIGALFGSDVTFTDILKML